MSYVFFAAALYLAPALDSTLGPACEVAGAAPQLMLLTGFGWIVLYRGRKAYMGGALAGMLADLSGGGRLGICFAIMTGCTIVLEVLEHRLPANQPAWQMLVVAVGTIACMLLSSWLGASLRGNEFPWPQLVCWLLLSGLYTGLLAWPVLYLAHRSRCRTNWA